LDEPVRSFARFSDALARRLLVTSNYPIVISVAPGKTGIRTKSTQVKANRAHILMR